MSCVDLCGGVHLSIRFRFRRSFKIAPGFRVNVSKSGVSQSFGRRGILALLILLLLMALLYVL